MDVDFTEVPTHEMLGFDKIPAEGLPILGDKMYGEPDFLLMTGFLLDMNFKPDVLILKDYTPICVVLGLLLRFIFYIEFSLIK